MIIENCIRALKRIEQLEQGQEVAINKADCEDCVNEGWAETVPNGGYVLTTKGRERLKAEA